MKSLVTSAAFSPMRAGEPDRTLQLCTSLAGQGLDVHLLPTKGSEVSSMPYKVWPIMRDWFCHDLPRLARFIKQFVPDAVLLMYSGWLYNDHPMITFVPTITRRLLPNVRLAKQLEIEEDSSWRSFGSRLVRKVMHSFRDRDNVTLCPPKDAESLAGAIQSLIHDPTLREQLRIGVARLARELFSWERTVERTFVTLQGGNSHRSGTTAPVKICQAFRLVPSPIHAF